MKKFILILILMASSFLGGIAYAKEFMKVILYGTGPVGQILPVDISSAGEVEITS